MAALSGQPKGLKGALLPASMLELHAYLTTTFCDDPDSVPVQLG